MRRFLVLSLLAFLSSQTLLWAADGPTVKIASFNILRLGQDGYDAKRDWDKTVEVLVQFDIVSLLEVIKEDGVQTLLEKVMTRDGRDWECVSGRAVGRGSYKEHYTFIWRDEDIDLVGGSEGAYPDDGDLLEREPYFATFRAGSFDFTLVAVHSYYGDATADRQAEARLVDDVFLYVQGLDPDEDDVILMGDFDLSVSDGAWSEMEEIPAIVHLFPGTFKTTLGTNNKRSSAYDNIWLQTFYTSEYTGKQGAYDFDDELYPGIVDAFKVARSEISDHVPVWATFCADQDDDGLTAVPTVSWGKVKGDY